MLRALLAIVIGLSAASFTTFAADEKKKADKEAKVTKLEGKLCCTKCSLSETDACGNALKVKDGDKEVIYYLDDKGAKAPYHKAICTEEKDATVEGKVVEKDKKKHIENPKVTFAKK